MDEARMAGTHDVRCGEPFTPMSSGVAVYRALDHGGSLSVESEVARYARFHLDLPVDGRACRSWRDEG